MKLAPELNINFFVMGWVDLPEMSCGFARNDDVESRHASIVKTETMAMQYNYDVHCLTANNALSRALWNFT